jgi:hypothetical protein
MGFSGEAVLPLDRVGNTVAGLVVADVAVQQGES